jgi:hypothetical protein
MEHFTIGVIKLKDAAEELLGSFWLSLAKSGPGRSGKPGRKPVLARSANSAIGESDVPDANVRGLLSILRAHLERKPFPAESAELLRACLNTRVERVRLIANSVDTRPLCTVHVHRRRVLAEQLTRYFDLLYSDVRVTRQQPLGLCPCGRVFLKSRKDQEYCSQRCYFPAWAAKHPNYRKSNTRMLAKRRKAKKHLHK